MENIELPGKAKSWDIIKLFIGSSVIVAIITGTFDHITHLNQSKKVLREKEIEIIYRALDNETITAGELEKKLTTLCLVVDTKNFMKICKKINEIIDTKRGKTLVIGTAYDSITNEKIANVEIANTKNSYIAKSNDDGYFIIDFDEPSDFNVILKYKKNGFKEEKMGLNVKFGSIRPVGLPLHK